ncbi:hypothetical protein PGH46_14040 [Legionella pneumophila]|nr:hypothetical protein PGH46_14040 [Legionella pneumophila]
MQTHQSLAWVGIQLYNTGCAFGIDQVCYGPTPTDTPDFSVAMATDLLENWPATVNGRPTGFQPYVSYLRPSQIVIGYPSQILMVAVTVHQSLRQRQSNGLFSALRQQLPVIPVVVLTLHQELMEISVVYLTGK